MTVPNVDKEIYLFTSDVEPVANDTAESVNMDVNDNDQSFDVAV